MTVPDNVYVMILLCVGHGETRRALRATAGSVERAGEMARIVVQTRVERINGKPSPFAEVYERLSWWSPWVGYITIYERFPASTHAAARFQLLWDRCNVGRRGRLATGWRYIAIYGHSCSTVLHKQFLEGRGWVSCYLIWTAAMQQPLD